MKRKVTRQDIKFVKKYYGKMTNKKIAYFLDRHHNYITVIAKRIGLPPLRQYSKWTHEKDDFIKENIGLMGHKQIAIELGCSVNAVIHRCKKYKLKLEDNIFTVPVLCQELGIKKRTLRYMMEKGFIKAKHAPWVGKFGKRPIIFSDTAIQRAMILKPKLFNLYRIENPFFKNMFREVLNKA